MSFVFSQEHQFQLSKIACVYSPTQGLLIYKVCFYPLCIHLYYYHPWRPDWSKGLTFLFWLISVTRHVWKILVHNNGIFYHLGPTQEKKKWLFSNFSFPVRDTKNWIKYHLNAYKKSIIDQNLEGVAEKLSLPRPLEFQN